ncbi:MAG: DUF4386 family protein [Pseudomonadota bacterium]
MSRLKISSRLFGAGILAGFALDIASNFWLQSSIRTGPGALGLLEGAVAQPEKIAAIVVMGLASGVIALLMAAWLCSVTAARPVYWLALAYLGAKVASLGMDGLELATFQMMRSVGETVLQASDGPITNAAEPLQLVVRALRNGIHFPHMLVGGFSAFLLYLILTVAGYIPRLLGGLGLVAVCSQMAGVFTGILGAEVHMGFLLPLFVVHLLLALWLIALGFRETRA